MTGNMVRQTAMVNWNQDTISANIKLLPDYIVHPALLPHATVVAMLAHCWLALERGE